MITPELIVKIRHLFFAEHWKIGTIAAQLDVHRDAVRAALETEGFNRARREQSDRLADDLTSVAIRVEEIQFPLTRAEIEIGSDLKQLRGAREFVRDFCCTSGILDDESVDAL